MTPLIKPAGYAAGLTLLWAVLAWNSPSTTYHLAPLLVAIAIPGMLRLNSEGVPPRLLVTAGFTGFALTLAATGILGWSDRLVGPSLLPFGGAVAEAVVFATGGALIVTAVTVFTTARSPETVQQ